MPFKSEAQHRKFRVLLREGKISKKTFDEWMDETRQQQGKKSPIKSLPERVEKTAFWKGFHKQAIDGGGKGFDAQGEGAASGQLVNDRIQGTQTSHGRGEEDTRTSKELLDRERNPRDYQVGNQGPVLEADSVPIQF